MNIIKLLFPEKEHSARIVFTLMVLSFVILFIRISITKTLYYTFLVWNIFLAIIPYFTTMYLSNYFSGKKKISRISFAILFAIWLVFLPNAPYIITDLFHLNISTFKNIWIDTLVIGAFAFTGLILFYFSLHKMKTLLLKFFSEKTSKIIIIITVFLSAFGVYVGRFLRFNSWEIISNPFKLFNVISNLIIQPIENKNVWFFTSIFGLFLWIGHLIFKRLKLNLKI